MMTVLFGGLIFFFLLNVPIGVAIGLASLSAILWSGAIPPVVLVQKMFTATDSFPLMAVPFFILAGSLMEFGGISRRLIDFANSIVGRFSGGLAFVAIVASMFFGAISGRPWPVWPPSGQSDPGAMVRGDMTPLCNSSTGHGRHSWGDDTPQHA